MLSRQLVEIETIYAITNSVLMRLALPVICSFITRYKHDFALHYNMTLWSLLKCSYLIHV